MFDENDDPIKEFTPFRIGIDNLTADDEDYSGFEAYSDLHECSNDLSEKGSIKEEREHARYAEAQRRKMYTQNGNTEKVLATGTTKWVIYFCIFAFIVVPVIQVLIDMITMIMGFAIQNQSNTADYSYPSSYDYRTYDYDYDDYNFDYDY